MSKVNTGQAPSTLIPKYIGSDFDKVVAVADNIEQVVIVGDNIEDVGTVADNINYVKEVAEDLHGMPVTMYTGETPPVLNPMPEGVMWYCTTDGRTYVWYTDADSGQWVESAPQSAMKDEATNIFFHSTPSNVNSAYRSATLHSTPSPEAEISVAHNALNTPVVQAQFIREEALWVDVSVTGAQGIVTLMGYSSGNSQLKAEIITWKNGAEGTSLGVSQWVTLPSQPSVVSLPVTLANIDVLDAGDSYVVKLTSQMSAGGSAVSTILVDGNTSSRFGIIFNTNLIGLNDGIRDGVITSAPTENAVYDALQLKVGKSQLVQSGNLTSTANWANVPAYSDSELGGSGGPLNAQAKALTARSELLLTDVREALRRSYAEVGFNVVGTFQAGFTYVNANDVSIDLATGKGYTGPVGPVASGTNPASGGFVDVSGSTTEERSFRSFGVTGLGFADDTAAMQDAIDWVGAKARRRVYGYPGEQYRITSGIVLRWDDKPYWDESSACIIDLTGTSFVAGADNITCLKVARNYAKVFNPKVSATGHVGVVAYALAPEDESQTTTKVSQMYCEIHDPEAQDCAVGIRFKPGPTVGGQDSGSFYHKIYNPRFRNVAVGFHFARSSTGSILNTRISIYSPVHVNGHCTFDIEAADSLNVWGGSAEFILNPGPHAGNPTIKVHKPVAGDALSSSNIIFWGFFGEAGTTPYDFMATESIALVNCTFFAYTNDGINNSYLLNNQLTNEGAVVSRAKYSNTTSPVLAVRREIGSNAGQAFLQYRNQSDYPAVFYADRGFTFTSVIEKCPAVYLQQASTPTQTYGSSSVTWNSSGFNNHVVLRQLAPLADGGWYFQTTADVSSAADDSATLGTTVRRWKQLYAVTGTINTSDARDKTAPNLISDDVLDAWGEVSHVTFKWLDAVAKKGDLARTHFGVIAQDVRDAFERHGLDGTKYGLLCYDAWDDEYEPIFEKREVTETVPDPDSPDGTRTITATKEVPTGESRLVKAAGDRWGIRPDQCLFLEAAYQRRRCDRIEARLSAAGL